MSLYYPAGYEDEEEDDDFYEFLKPRVITQMASNGGPKSLGEAVTRKDAEALLKIIKICIIKKVSLDYDNITNSIPLLSASSYFWVEGVKLLLEYGANPNVHKELITPLATCCSSIGFMSDFDQGRCVDLLLKYGADPNFCDHRGRVPLMLAARNGLVQAVEKLLQCPRTDLDVVDPAGWTALFFAMESNNQDVIDKLILAGLDPKVKAYNSISAEDVRPCPAPLSSDVKVAELFMDSVVPEYFKEEALSDVRAEEHLKSLLCLLPDADGRGGFSDCVNAILDGMRSVSNTSGIQLSDILCGDERILEQCGVKLSHYRSYILKTVHRFHLLSWKNTAIADFSEQELRSLEDVGNMIMGMLRHLVIIQSAVQYLSLLIDSSKSNNGSTCEGLVTVLVDLFAAQVSLRRRIQTLTYQLYRVKPLEVAQADYVTKDNSLRKRTVTFKALSAVATICGTFVIYCLTRLRKNIK